MGKAKHWALRWATLKVQPWAMPLASRLGRKMVPLTVMPMA